MDKLPDPVQIAIPAFVLLVAAEMAHARWRGGAAAHRYCPRDTMTSLMLGFGSSVAGALFGGAIVGIAAWVHGFRLFDVPYAWWAWPVCFALDDLAYYWFHRSAHRVRWFWASHVIHHSSQHYNLSTALRQTWTGFLSASFVFRLPLFALGFPVPMLLFCAGLNLVYQFWIHTEAVGRLPRPIEAVFNTPSHHRVHHATNARYLDRNYAGVFIVWDRLFGTYEPEVDGDRPRYGIVRNLGSFNLLWAAFHEWVGIARDLAGARSWRERLGFAFGPPGWSRDGARETSEAIRARWEAENFTVNEGSSPRA